MAEENGFLLSVEKAVRLRPQAPAYRAADGTTMTYGELWKLSDAIAALSKAGLGYTVISGPQDLNAVVIQSNPGAGTQLDPNTQVQLFTRPADPAKGGDPLTTPPTKGGNDH